MPKARSRWDLPAALSRLHARGRARGKRPQSFRRPTRSCTTSNRAMQSPESPDNLATQLGSFPFARSCAAESTDRPVPECLQAERRANREGMRR